MINRTLWATLPLCKTNESKTYERANNRVIMYVQEVIKSFNHQGIMPTSTQYMEMSLAENSQWKASCNFEIGHVDHFGNLKVCGNTG